MESGIIGFGIRNTAQGILNPTNDKNPAESNINTSSPESKVWNHEFKTVIDSLTWGEIFILYLFIHLVSSPLCCEHQLLEVNTTCQINATSSLVPRPVRAIRVTRGGLEPSAIARGRPRLPTSLTGDVTSKIAEDDWERGCATSIFFCALRQTNTLVS